MQLGDLSVLDQLKQVRSQTDTLDVRLKAMEEKRGQVADQVYVRVRADYASQRETLAAQAAPLKLKARELYGQLQGELVRLDEAFEEHRLAHEELELRHSLGEFGQAEFEQRKQVIADQLGSRREAREQALAVRARFVDAFGSERELEAVPSTPAPMPVPSHGMATQMVTPVKGPPPADSVTVALAPVQAPSHAPIHTPPAMEIPPPRSDTAIMTPVAPPPPVPEAQPVPPPPAAPKRANPDGTLVFRPGRLLPLTPDAGIAPTTLSLKPIVIGSDNSCDIRLSQAGIARRQVEIIMSRAGFNLKDVAGGNLVSVNGQVVSEKILEDGDTLTIGTAQFQFKRG